MEHNYFLIGGSGFMGGAFAAFLQRQYGIQPIIINRGGTAVENVETIMADYGERYSIHLRENIVIDFAYTSVPNTSFSDPIKDFSENLFNTNEHLAFAARLPNAHFIYISSGGTVYGNTFTQTPITEDAPNFPLSPYGITKLASEKYIWMYKEINNLNIKIVRPSNVYGPGQRPYRGQGFVATAIADILLNKEVSIFGNGDIIRDYIFIDDFCFALNAIVKKGESGNIYNVGTGKGLTLNELLHTISKSKHLKSKETKIKYRDGRPYDVAYNVLNAEKLKNICPSFIKTSIEEGINFTVEWVKNYLDL